MISYLALRFAQIVNESEVNLPKADVSQDTVKSALQIVFGVAGGIALIIVTLSGLRYVLSNGDPQGVAKAKNSIIYALLGLVICLTAFGIVTFVVGRV